MGGGGKAPPGDTRTHHTPHGRIFDFFTPESLFACMWFKGEPYHRVTYNFYTAALPLILLTGERAVRVTQYGVGAVFYLKVRRFTTSDCNGSCDGHAFVEERITSHAFHILTVTLFCCWKSGCACTHIAFVGQSCQLKQRTHSDIRSYTTGERLLGGHPCQASSYQRPADSCQSCTVNKTPVTPTPLLSERSQLLVVSIRIFHCPKLHTHNIAWLWRVRHGMWPLIKQRAQINLL